MRSRRPSTHPAAALRRGRARVSAVREPGPHLCAPRVGAFHPLRARGAHRPGADPGPRNESEPRLHAAWQGALGPCLPPCRLGRFGRVVGGCVQHGFDRLPERAAVPSAAFARGFFDQAERGREALRSRGRNRRRYRGCDHCAPGVCWRTGSRCLRPDWSIEINGVAFADAGFAKPDTNFGTFSNYNAAGIFLVFAWFLFAAAGSRCLGLPARAGLLSDRVSRERFSCPDRGRAVLLLPSRPS